MSDPKETKPGPDRRYDTTQDKRVVHAFTQLEQFDEILDREPELTTREALSVLGRGFMLVRNAKGLFFGKWFMETLIALQHMFLGWFAKIMIDNVILQQPLIAEEAKFPPHFMPIVYALDGRGPMELLLILTGTYFVVMTLIGYRAGGTGAGLFAGRDTATRGENAISGGGSRAAGIWGVIEFWINVRLSQRIANTIRTQLFNRLSGLRMANIDNTRVGDHVFRVMYDAPMAPSVVYELAFAPFFIVFGFVTASYQMLFTYGDRSPTLVFMCCMMLPIVLVVTLPLNRYVRRIEQNKRAAGSATTNSIEETLSNISAVQSLGSMAKETEKFAERSAHAYWRERMTLILWVGIGIVIACLEMPITYIVLWVATNELIEGNITVGDMGAIFVLYMGIRESAQNLGRVFLNVQDQIAAVRRMFFFIDLHNDEDEHRDGMDLPPIEKGVVFQDVSYTYPAVAGGAEKQALNDINLELNVNEVVALVGPTGSGKTSLAYLLPAFLTPTSGKVTIDGQDINESSLDSLRGQISYVFQEQLFFSDSIRDNLRLAKPDATDEEIRAVLQTARCTDFVDNLPNGIDTPMGRAGDTLSVGQQQRLSIARGLIRNSKILILDEPTAALDPQTENALVQSLRSTSEGRLVVVIAHRLSTIRRADRIVFLEDGEVKDVGSHDELMSDPDSRYRRFVELQTA